MGRYAKIRGSHDPDETLYIKELDKETILVTYINDRVEHTDPLTLVLPYTIEQVQGEITLLIPISNYTRTPLPCTPITEQEYYIAVEVII